MWAYTWKRTTCFTAPIIIPLIPHYCKRNCIDIFLCILTTAKSLTSVGMHTVVTYPFHNSNLETKYQVTKMCLQIHSIIIEPYGKFMYPMPLHIQKERLSRKWQSQNWGFLHHFLLNLLTWLQTGTTRQSIGNFYRQPLILPEISKDLKT